MKKVILYGIRNLELRRRAEMFLSDDYAIVGYSDGHYKYDVLDGKTFYSPSELGDVEFDYILLLSDSEVTIKDMRQQLWMEGVPYEKMICPVYLKPNVYTGECYNLIDIIRNGYRNEPNIIFGLSYSLYCIFEKELSLPTFDCSLNSNDLYYNYSIYNYFMKNGMFTDIERVIFVFPYYYFDYDYSVNFGRGLRDIIVPFLNYFELDDWHNAKNVDEMIVNARMFGKKLCEYYHNHPMYLTYLHNSCLMEKGSFRDVYSFREFPETFAENKRIFQAFCKDLTERKIQINLIVPPFYIGAFDDLSIRAFARKKDRFYSVINELIAHGTELRIFDCFDLYPDNNKLFVDQEHLNYKGAKLFTEYINRHVLMQ